MGTTTTYGYKKPSTGDNGTSFFGDLEDNIDRVDAHTHDGLDSAKMTSKSVKAVTHTPALTWTNNGDGTYQVTVTVPAGVALCFGGTDGSLPMFTLGNELAPLKCTILSTTTFKLESNDNTIAPKVHYIS